MDVMIRRARPEDTAVITEFVIALTVEIMERTAMPYFDIDRNRIATLCRSYLETGVYTVLLALSEQRAIGFVTQCESHALYTGGTFGIVQEFYVLPAQRSRAVGRILLEQAVREARSRGWRRLELCTPPLPEFERTVAFYNNNDFEITGGRKMRRLDDPL